MAQPGGRNNKWLFPAAQPPQVWGGCHGFALPVRLPSERPFEQASGEFVNNSGQGQPAPPEIVAMGFCRPAYWISFPWLLAHGIGDLRMSVGGMWARRYLGTYGYQLAWMSRRFQSLEHFGKTMAVWDRWARVVMGLWVALLVLGSVCALRWSGSGRGQ